MTTTTVAPPARPAWVPYALAVALTGVTAAVRVGLERLGWLEGAPFLLLAVPVVVSAWLGGFGPGVLSTILAIGFAHFLFPYAARNAGDADPPTQAARLAAFAVEGLIISWLGQARLSVLASLRRSGDQLEHTVGRRTEALRQSNASLIAEAAERQRVADELRDKEERLRLLIDSVRDYAIFMLDPEGRVASWNATAERIMGYTAAEVIGRHFSMFYPPEDVAAGKPRREVEVASEHGRSEEEGWRVRKDGSRLWANVVVTPVRDPDTGALRGFSKITRDVTERRQRELALQALNARLEASNRELQDFASVASHDLQEPLRKIQAFGDRLNAKFAAALGDEGKDYLLRMLNAASRMQTLINDLLTFSRVTTKAQPFVPVDLRQVAAEVLSDLEARVERGGAKVEVGDLPTIDADPLQMRQLLQNLLGNALKFTRPGVAPVIRLYGNVVAEDGTDAPSIPPIAAGEPPASPPPTAPTTSPTPTLCRIYVEDNGIGFEEKYLDRIFNVFQRLHGRGVYEGTGIGLAVCRKIVERHGGSITARSTPGEGATFVVTLPTRQEAAAEAAQAADNFTAQGEANQRRLEMSNV